MNYAPPVIPPFRFSIVENGLYRGGYPTLKNFRFLRRLRLSTIVALVDPGSEASSDLQEFCSKEKIQLRTFPVKKFDDKVAIPPELAAEIVGQIINAAELPLYLHCRDGSHNTGLIIMVLRRLQNWNLRTIYDECSRFMKTGDLTRDEVVYLESFKAEVQIPHKIPPWLWEGSHIHSHPVMKFSRRPLPTLLETSDNDSVDSDGVAAYSTSTTQAAPSRGDFGGPQMHMGAASDFPNSQAQINTAVTWDDLLVEFNESVSTDDLVTLRAANENQADLLPDHIEAIVVAGSARPFSFIRKGQNLSRAASGLALEGLPLWNRRSRD